MIRGTRKLLDYLTQERKLHWPVISALTNHIELHGGPRDGEAVGTYLLKHQGNYLLSPLYQVVKKCGSSSIAESFFQKAIADGRLKEGFDLEILEVLGKFKLEEAKPVLVEYALGDSDYYTNLHAVRGLLNYNCEDLQDRIRTAIEEIYNKSLFNELLPALVCKLQDRTEVLENLFNTGNEFCSTDCNGGIFLGFSLCGEQGLPYFKRALFSPAWEAHYPPRHYVVEGMQNLGITFSELFKEVRGFTDIKEQEYGLHLLLSLLEVKIKSGKLNKEVKESFSDIMDDLFSLKNKNFSGDFIIFAEKFGFRDEAYKLENLLSLRLREEAISDCQ